MLCSNFAMMHNGSVEALESLAVVHYRMKSYADAVADANEALRIEPKGASALYLRGLAKLRQGDPAAAKLDFAASQAFDTRIAEKFAIHGLTP
jgi:Flp pilus assembly protein TadD